MNNFFHGWRRKLGCMTLVMACAFCTLWVRSLRTADTVVVALGGTSLEARSERGVLELMIHWVSGDGSDIFGLGRSVWYSKELPEVLYTVNGIDYISAVEDTGLDWRRERKVEFHGFMSASGGFDFGSEGRVATKLIGFPYWFAAIPMTLLSTWLILVRPRQRIATPQQTEAPHA